MKMAKKVLAVLLSVLFVVGVFTACSSNSGDTKKKEDTTNSATSKLKVGFIFLHDKNSTYDLNFIKAADAACKKLGITGAQKLYKTQIPEGQEAYDAAVDLAEQGCNIIFADSFGHEPYIIEAAKKYPNVQFCHSTGTRAHTEGLANYHNAFASIYEGRYLAGIAAGMKLNEMIEKGEFKKDEAKMGYVGAFPYAEVISGYTAFYLGAKSVCPSVTMEVKYTNSWASFDLEKECADALISDGCVLISQHADTTGAPTACEAAGVPCVGYNIDMTSVAPNTALTSASMDWGVYYTYAVQCMLDGTAIDTDWCKGFAEGADKITALNDKTVAEGTEEKVKEVEDALIDGSLHVFDTSAFTVDGKELDTYKKGDTEYISDGYFHESEYGSAPAFDIAIDGITSITE